MKLEQETVTKLWLMCNRKFSSILPSREEKHSPRTYRKRRVELWLSYLESNGIQVRRSRECFFRFEEVVVLSGFNPRRTYKIGFTREMVEKILVLGGLP